MFQSLLWQFGGDLTSEDGTKATWNSDAGVQPDGVPASLIQTAATARATSARTPTTIAFKNGQSAFIWNGAWAIGDYGATEGLSGRSRRCRRSATSPRPGRTRTSSSSCADAPRPRTARPRRRSSTPSPIAVWADRRHGPGAQRARETARVPKLPAASLAEEIPFVRFPRRPGPLGRPRVHARHRHPEGAQRRGPSAALDASAKEADSLLESNVEVRHAMGTGASTSPRRARAPSAAGRARVRGEIGMRASTPWLFLAPYLVLFAMFVLAPAVYGLWISLHNWDQFLAEKPWVGLDNYVQLFTPGSGKSAPFWNAMHATGIFTVFSVPLLVVSRWGWRCCSTAVPRRGFFRALYFAPYVLGVAVVSILFRFLLDPNIGALNYLLGQVGLPDDTPWTTALRGRGSRSSG